MQVNYKYLISVKWREVQVQHISKTKNLMISARVWIHHRKENSLFNMESIFQN